MQQAILTFEDDQLDRALENLKRAQRVCYVENTAKKGPELGRDEQLMRQILYADCELYMALLTFLKQGEISLKFIIFLNFYAQVIMKAPLQIEMPWDKTDFLFQAQVA